MTGPATQAPVVPLRPLGAAGILDGAVRLVRRHARACLTISVPLALVASALGAVTALAGSSLALQLRLPLVLAVSGSIGGVRTGLLTPVLAGDPLGERVSAGDAVRRIGWRWVPLVVLAVVASTAQSLGLVFSVLGGAALWGLWAVVAPAFVVERLGVRRAFGRSLALVRGAFWRTFGLRAVGWLLVTVLGLFVQLPFLAVAALVAHVGPSHAFTAGSATYVAIVAVGTLVTDAVLGPVASAVDVLLYLDLRMRREGLDLVLALPAPPALAPAAAAVPAAPW